MSSAGEAAVVGDLKLIFGGDFAVELEHNPNILAYLTTAIDKNDVIEQEDTAQLH